MSRIIPLSFVITSLLLVGCAKNEPLVVGPDHPSNPQAAEAPLLPPSQTLAISESTAPAPLPATTPGKMEMQHGMHGMSDMQHDMHGMQGMQHEMAATRPGEGPAPSAPRFTPSTFPATTRAAAIYTCAMHPEVVSEKPGNCPKCGMKLVLKQDAKTSEHGGHE